MPNQTAETVTITTRPCMFCHQVSAVDVTPEQAAQIEARSPIQLVLPDAEPAARELLISGTHPSCWAEAFG
ncbi:MAG TPA: hypothetical protein PLK46_11390 [Propioniciclava sp.]|uniref:hypothetical protein n=1 Tax=Propioniciclava sp. TaxID=2038686 RepID=UPI002B73A6A9|nr:hypothetical protein [Propioniciclava sp.]HRL80920.1 hypothetical protein [Propioniciclava sp.]